MLKCKDVTEQASAYIDGELGFFEGLNYRFHLAICKHCQTFSQNFQAGIEMIKMLPKEEIDQDRVDAVQRRIKDNS
ncbi:MAG: zf-HC2 domain-containing protein [Motiliproteus sp.]